MGSLIHVANILYLTSYSVRDIFWLRILTVTAASCLIPYWYFRPSPLIEPICWNLLFISINCYQIYRLYLERRPVRFSPEEGELYRMTFRCLTPREFLKLIAQGTWEEAQADDLLVKKGQPLDKVMVIYSGKVAVRIDDRSVAELKPGQFIGEISYLTNEAPSASVVALEPTRVLTWPVNKLRVFLTQQPDVRSALQVILGTDLAHKLKSS